MSAKQSSQAGALMPSPAGPTWSVVAVHLLVRHRHDGVLELFSEVRDGLVDQEDSHSHEQQVDEDEQDREDVLQAGLAEADAAGGRLAVDAWGRTAESPERPAVVCSPLLEPSPLLHTSPPLQGHRRYR